MSKYPAKILYSPGFGAGWYTWNREYGLGVLTYQPLINAIEVCNREHKHSCGKENRQCGEFRNALAMFEKDYPDAYTGGARDLQVITVAGPFRIHEYDGSERVIDCSNDSSVIDLDNPSKALLSLEEKR